MSASPITRFRVGHDTARGAWFVRDTLTGRTRRFETPSEAFGVARRINRALTVASRDRGAS